MAEEKQSEGQESSASVRVSLEDPEMALLQGGLFVVSIPLNSKKVSKVIALGMLYTGLDKLCSIYRQTERMKEEHEERKRRGDLSLAKKVMETGHDIADLATNLFKR